MDHFFLKCNIYTEHRIQLFRGMSNLGFDISIENILFGNASFEYTSDDNDLVYPVYVSVFVLKDKYYTKLTLIFQPIELFLSCYVIFNFCCSSYSYYLYL